MVVVRNNNQKTPIRDQFVQAFGLVEDQILAELHSIGIPQEAVDWISTMVEYNVPGGKMNRGLAVVETCKFIRGDSFSDADAMLSFYLGWCIEILQASFLMADDIMDQSLTRRGRTCWYLKSNVGLKCMNDAFVLQSIVYRILKKHFHDQPNYTKLTELFLEITYQTELGQLLDLITAPNPRQPDFKKFTCEQYYTIVRLKTAYYSFYLPVALALTQCQITDPIVFELAKNDDYLDCFGDADVTGKIGTDIAEGKCTWLAVNALKRASPDQTSCMYNNYGKADQHSQDAVRQVYSDLDLEIEFQELEVRTEREISAKIQAIQSVDPKVALALKSFADRIFYRNK